MQKRRRNSGKKKPENEESGEKLLPTYCICRSTDGERFMIACDKCEEWYHGDCISVTPKQAEQIKTFYCHQCRLKNSSLQIEYKNTRTQRPKPSRRPLSPGSSTSTYAEQTSPVKSKSKRPNPANINNSDVIPKKSLDRPSPRSSFKNTRKFIPDMKASPTLLDGVTDVSGSLSPPSSLFPRSYWSHDDRPKFDETPTDSSSLSLPKKRPGSPKPRPCGQCHGCTKQEDCGSCDFCRDRRKFGGNNKLHQKCRLRQCVGMSASRSRNPSNSSQSLGSRRRKQQPIQSAQIEPVSPRLQSYADFDDEPFEVPMTFSPRPYSDIAAQALLGQHPSGHGGPIGSKMRRGDHRVPSASNDLDSLTARHFSRFTIDGPLGTAPNSRPKGSLASVYPLSANDFMEDGSDDDVVLPDIAHCLGPACMLPATPGNKYCSDLCKARHTGSRTSVRSQPQNARSCLSSAASREATAMPYNLSYPDHMYCRHHRVQNWHGNGSVAAITSPAYRSVNQFNDHFSIDQSYLSETLRQTRGHPSFHYSSGPMHISQRQNNLSNNHSVMINTSNRLSSLDNQGHAIVCDAVDTDVFMDPMASTIRRNTSHAGVGALVEELGLDLPHPSHTPAGVTHLSSSPALTGVNSCFAGSSQADAVRSVELHHVVDPDDGLPPDVDDDESEMDHNVSQSGSHPVYGYYMMGYSTEVTNGHVTRNLDSSSVMSERRLNASSLRPNVPVRTVGHRLLVPENGDVNTNLGASYQSTRNLPLRSSDLRHSVINSVSSNMNANNCLSPGPASGVTDLAVTCGPSLPNTNVTSHSISNYLPGPDEFYTINDSDDLEINWPQETVAGVNS